MRKIACGQEGRADFLVTLNPKDFPQAKWTAKGRLQRLSFWGWATLGAMRKELTPRLGDHPKEASS